MTNLEQLAPTAATAVPCPSAAGKRGQKHSSVSDRIGAEDSTKIQATVKLTEGSLIRYEFSKESPEIGSSGRLSSKFRLLLEVQNLHKAGK